MNHLQVVVNNKTNNATYNPPATATIHRRVKQADPGLTPVHGTMGKETDYR